MNARIKYAIIDDHQLFRSGVRMALKNSEYLQLQFEAESGKKLVDRLTHLKQEDIPDVITLDIQMPEMDGLEALDWLKLHMPQIKVLMLTMHNSPEMILQSIKAGANGFLTKNASSEEIINAIVSIYQTGFYCSPRVGEVLFSEIHNGNFLFKRLVRDPNIARVWESLSERERTFVLYACTELTYQEIALKMGLSPKTIDGYRDKVFESFNVKTRVGIVLFAIHHQLIDLDRMPILKINP